MTRTPRDGNAEPRNRRAFLGTAAAAVGVGTVLGGRSRRASPAPPEELAIGTATTRTGTDVVDTPTPEPDRPSTPMLGANLNGRPRRLNANLDRLDDSNTTWVRAFLDVREKAAAGTDPSEDPDVVGLRRAALERGCRLIVSLKWDFTVNWAWDDKEPVPVPPPGSERERELFERATRCLAGVGAPLDVVVLGNEPMWETKREDIVGEDPPVVRFTRRLKEHLLRHGDHGEPTYLLGAFNRLHLDRVREERFPEFCRAMFRMAREDEDVAGVDLHVHYGRLGAARRMLEVARERVPDGVVTVTEFSPVFRYRRNVRTPIGEWETGRRFASEYGYPPEMTAVDYFERAKDDPRPRRELGDFYGAMPWYRGDELRRAHRLFERYDVGVGTLGFLQGVGMRNADWRRPGWMPFHINFLYQDALLRGRGRHPLYMDDYRELAR